MKRSKELRVKRLVMQELDRLLARPRPSVQPAGDRHR